MVQIKIICRAFLVAIAYVVVNCSTAVACPTCKESMANDSSGIEIGYAISIGLMMLTPMAILAVWALFIFKMVRQSRPSLPNRSRIESQISN